MGQPFDHSRFDWYPTVVFNGVKFGPEKVIRSDGTLRPALPIPLPTFTVHYGGAGQWLDPGDTALELAAIERNHAIPNKKPNEYNSSSDSDAATWEWSGRFQAAHSEGENGTSWGHLAVLGLEMPTEAQADKLIEGIRKARAQGVAAGYLTADHAVVPHQGMPGASTNCPGPLYTNKRWWNRIIAPLTNTTPPSEGNVTMTTNTWWADPPQRVAAGVGIGAGQTVGIHLGQTPAAVTLAITVDADQDGFLTVWSGVKARPTVSNVTFSASPNVTSQVSTLVASSGFFSIYAHGRCKVWVDLIATHS